MTRVLIFKDPGGFSVLDVNAPAEKIVEAVNQGRTEIYFPEITGCFFARQQSDIVIVTSDPPDLAPHQPRFSRREQEVLVLLGEGLTTAQIACHLKLSQRTIGVRCKMKSVESPEYSTISGKGGCSGAVSP